MTTGGPGDQSASPGPVPIRWGHDQGPRPLAVVTGTIHTPDGIIVEIEAAPGMTIEKVEQVIRGIERAIDVALHGET